MVIYEIENLTIDDTYTFDGSTGYMSNPQAVGYANSAWGGYVFNVPDPPHAFQLDARVPEDPGRRAGYIKDYGDNVYAVNTRFNITYGNITNVDIGIRWGGTLDSLSGDPLNRFGISDNIVSTNMPIFLTFEEAERYIQTGEGGENAVNYREAVDTKNSYYIWNQYNDAVVTEAGVEYASTLPFTRYEEFEIIGFACLYQTGQFTYEIRTNGDVTVSKFGTSGLYQTDTERIGSLIYDSPFYYWHDGVTLGEYKIAYPGYGGLKTNIPKYHEGQESIMENYLATGNPQALAQADNYYELLNQGSSQSIYNPTGDITEKSTEMGEVFHSSIFSKKYVLSKSQVQAIANGLYDNTGALIEDIKKGLEMWGNNPIEAVIDLSYYPLNMASVLETSPQNYVYFGGYKFDLPSSVGKVVYENGYIDLGSFRYLPTFNSWRDFEPYSKTYITIPYCGTYQLDIQRYLGKVINIRMYIDTNTRGCLACVFADGKLIDTYNGVIGAQTPITLTNFGEYANATIGTLLGGGQNIVGGASQGMSGGSVGGAVGSAVGGALGTAGGILKTEYALTRNNVNNFNKTVGSSSAIINEFLPQYVSLIFETMDIEEPSLLAQLYGKPSTASGKIEGFRGFLQVDSVDLICTGATDSEKDEIVSLLSRGIRI